MKLDVGMFPTRNKEWPMYESLASSDARGELWAIGFLAAFKMLHILRLSSLFFENPEANFGCASMRRPPHAQFLTRGPHPSQAHSQVVFRKDHIMITQHAATVSLVIETTIPLSWWDACLGTQRVYTSSGDYCARRAHRRAAQASTY